MLRSYRLGEADFTESTRDFYFVKYVIWNHDTFWFFYCFGELTSVLHPNIANEMSSDLSC